MRISDWSSDVCSSDLGRPFHGAATSGVSGIGSFVGHDFADFGGRLAGDRAGQGVHLGVGEAGGVLAALGMVRQAGAGGNQRSEEHTSELQSLMRISYAVFCLKKKKNHNITCKQ